VQNAIETYQDIQSNSANKEWRDIASEKIRYLQGK
jgi:hypothetical protein